MIFQLDSGKFKKQFSVRMNHQLLSLSVFLALSCSIFYLAVWIFGLLLDRWLPREVFEDHIGKNDFLLMWLIRLASDKVTELFQSFVEGHLVNGSGKLSAP